MSYIGRVLLVLLFLAFVTLIPARAAPGINRTVNFQGKVVNSDGTNVADGSYDFTFKVWDQLSAGTSLWTEVYSGASQIGVSSGIFSVDLGSNTEIGTSIDFNSDSLYLSVSFNNNGDMEPRIRMAGVPYAFNAEKVNGLTVTNTTGTLTIPNGELISFGESFTTTGVGITLDQSLSTGDTVSFSGLTVGGDLTFSGLSVGTGTTILYIAGDGSIVAGTLPSTAYNKTLVLSPEYPGAVLSADGSVNTDGSMTSDNSLNSGGSGWKNYYEWSSTQATLQDYSILVRVTLPTDFGTWQTGSCPGSTCALEFYYQTGVGTTGDNYVAYNVSNDTDTPGTVVCSIGDTAATSWQSSGCPSTTLDDGVAPEWDAAGETAVIRVKTGSKNTSNALVRPGDIILRYRSTF